MDNFEAALELLEGKKVGEGNGIPTEITFKNGNSSKVGEAVKVNIVIDDHYVGVTGGDCTLCIYDANQGQVYTNTRTYRYGGIEFKSWTPKSPGIYTIVVKYAGNPQTGHDPSEANMTYTVTSDDLIPTTTTITSGNSSGIGKAFTTTATIIGQDGKAVLDGIANFTVTLSDGTVTHSVVKNVKDGLSFKWTPSSIGICTLKLTYVPAVSSKYASSEATQSFEVTEDKTPTNVKFTSGSSSLVGKAFVIKANVLGMDLKKVSGDVLLKITYKNTGKSVLEKNVTLKDGLFSCSWTPSKVGDYIINLMYKGNDQYDSSSAKQNFQVDDLVLTVKNVKMSYGDGSKFIVKALNAQGKPKANLAVNVKISGKNFKLTTNKKGLAELTIKLKPNNYKVVTTVPGTSIKKVSTITVSKWKKSLTSLIPKGLVKVYNTPKRFYVSLKYNKAPIAGQYIKVKVLKYTYYILTNSKGVASLGIHYYPGVYKAKVSINIAGVSLSKNANIVVKKR